MLVFNHGIWTRLGSFILSLQCFQDAFFSYCLQKKSVFGVLDTAKTVFCTIFCLKKTVSCSNRIVLMSIFNNL